jgi:hypothetical protein
MKSKNVIRPGYRSSNSEIRATRLPAGACPIKSSAGCTFATMFGGNVDSDHGAKASNH